MSDPLASNYGITLNADGSATFNADALIGSAEASAVASMGDAIEKAIEDEADMAAFAISFVAGVVGAEVGVSALIGGATVAAAVAAGEAAGTAAAAAAGAAAATGPAAPILIIGLALVAIQGGDIFAFLGGFDPFKDTPEKCCGDPPDFSRHAGETQLQAAQRGTRDAMAKNQGGGCAGNHSITDYVGPMTSMPEDGLIAPMMYPGDDARLWPFLTMANHLLLEFVGPRGAGYTSCWPLARRDRVGHLLAMSVAAWNAQHEGPTVFITRGVREDSGPYVDLVHLALDWGNLTWIDEGGGNGYYKTVLPLPSSGPLYVRIPINVGPLKSASSLVHTVGRAVAPLLPKWMGPSATARFSTTAPAPTFTAPPAAAYQPTIIARPAAAAISTPVSWLNKPISWLGASPKEVAIAGGAATALALLLKRLQK